MRTCQAELLPPGRVGSRKSLMASVAPRSCRSRLYSSFFAVQHTREPGGGDPKKDAGTAHLAADEQQLVGGVCGGGRLQAPTHCTLAPAQGENAPPPPAPSCASVSMAQANQRICWEGNSQKGSPSVAKLTPYKSTTICHLQRTSPEKRGGNQITPSQQC